LRRELRLAHLVKAFVDELAELDGLAVSDYAAGLME
jgi:hypothetical protein